MNGCTYLHCSALAYPSLLCISCCLLWACVADARAAEDPPRKPASAVRLNGELAMDGTLGDPSWRAAPVQTGFEMQLSERARAPIPADRQTEFRVLYDDDAMYFGVRCAEPRMDLLRCYEDPTAHDAAMWLNDDIELFIDPIGDRLEYYHFAIDPNGAQYDGYKIEAGNTGKPYSSVWQVETHKAKDAWTAEVRIPFAALHMRPASEWSETWGLSVARTRPRDGECWYAQYSPTDSGYHNVAEFGTLAGVTFDAEHFRAAIDQPVCRLVPGDRSLELQVSSTLRNRSSTPFAGRLSVGVPGAEPVIRKVGVPADGTAPVSVAGVRVEREGLVGIVLDLRDARGRQVFIARHDRKLRYVPLSIRVTSPNYRNAIYSSQTVDTISGELTLGLPAGEHEGATAEVMLHVAGHNARAASVPVTGERVVFTLPADGLPIGGHRLTARIVKGGRTLAAAETVIRKLPPAPDVEVRVDTNGDLLVDGSPVFIRGWYANFVYNVGRSSLPQAQVPLSTNFIMSESTRDLWCLTDVHRLIDEGRAKRDTALDDDTKRKLDEAVDGTHGKRHVLGYYLADEPGYRGVPAEYLGLVYDYLRELDPYRFVMVVDTSAREYVPATDVICTHPYVNPMVRDGVRRFATSIPQVLDVQRAAYEANDGSKAVWAMPQSFSYSFTGDPRCRHPNLTETRWSVYTALACGARGIVPFIFCDFWNHWENRVSYNAVFEELSLLEPLLLGGRENAHAVVQDGPVTVLARTGRFTPDGPEHTVVVAANEGYQDQWAAIRLKGSPARRLVVLREDRVIDVADGVIRDRFAPLQTHIYTTLEALPHLATIAELEDAIQTPRLRAAASGNILGRGDVRWQVGEGVSFVDMDSTTSHELADGILDAPGWFCFDGSQKECLVCFEKPVAFTRVVVHSPMIADASLDVFAAGAWTTVHRWRGNSLERLEWTGQRIMAEKLRITIEASRAGPSGSARPEIAELELHE